MSSYRQRRWRPIRWWEIASLGDTSQMPFLRYYPEPPAVLVAQIVSQARAMAETSASTDPSAAAPEDPWGEDGDIARSWFLEGDEIVNQPARDADQGGTHA